VLWIRIGSGFNEASGSGFAIRIRIQEGKNAPEKQKETKISSNEECSLDVLYGGKGINK
jgi:hypothetical protein